MSEPSAASGAARRLAGLSPQAFAARIRRLSLASGAIGALLIGLGLASATVPTVPLYTTPFAGYDPPFAVVAGILLIVLAPRVRERTAFAWLFSLLAPVLTVPAAVLSPNPLAIAAAVAASALVLALYRYRGSFYHRSPGGRSGSTELAVLVTGLLSLLLGTVGSRWLGGQFTPSVRSWPEAIYFTVTTISTNGSAIEPLTSAARLFVVALILLGVGTFLSAVVVLFLPFLERRLSTLTARLERTQMQELEQHVIVCGVSPEAVATARALRTAGARTVLLSPDSQALELLRSEGFRTHLGDPSAEEDLASVGVDRARAVVVAQSSDAENLLTVITVRARQPALRIVAIASSDSTLPKLRRAGANEAVSVVGVAAEMMSTAALGPDGVGRSRPGSPPG
jgi:voltage-gated potassium channel